MILPLKTNIYEFTAILSAIMLFVFTPYLIRVSYSIPYQGGYITYRRGVLYFNWERLDIGAPAPTGKTVKDANFMVVNAEFSGKKQEPFNLAITGKNVDIDIFLLTNNCLYL